MLLSEAMEKFDLARRTEVEESTLTLYTYTFNKLLAYLGDVPIEEIRTDDLRKWRAKVAASPGRHQSRQEEGKEGIKLSVYTLHRDIRQVKTFFRWCVEEEILKKNPATRLTLPKLPRGEPPKAISDKDMERMIAAALVAITERPESSDGRTRKCNQGLKPYPYERDYAMIRFLAESGCRVGGLAGLRWENLDLPAKEGTVCEKGKVSRMVPYGRETVAALEAWRSVQPNYNPYVEFVFSGERGALTTSGLYQILHRLAIRAGVGDRHNPHSFRHALARRLLKHRADMGTVSELLGHSNIETTHKFYARWSKEELANRHRQYGGTLD